MIAIEKMPELEIHSESGADLRVEPSDITFEDLSDDMVRISVRVRNEGYCRSKPTFMALQSAPLGAFVTWQPLAALPVPALEPGESRALHIDATRPRPATLGSFDRIPPRRLLTAASPADAPSPRPNAGRALMSLLLRNGRSGTRAILPPDLWDHLGRGQPHWAGNINVFIGVRDVERHYAKALRIYPGRTNLAMFMVGDRTSPDSFAFDLIGLAPDWKVALIDATHSRTLLDGASDAPIQGQEWLESSGGLMVMSAVQPPADCGEGKVEIHVTRRSCQKTAVVEFDLDPAAQGAGCYVA